MPKSNERINNRSSRKRRTRKRLSRKGRTRKRLSRKKLSRKRLSKKKLSKRKNIKGGGKPDLSDSPADLYAFSFINQPAPALALAPGSCIYDSDCTKSINGQYCVNQKCQRERSAFDFMNSSSPTVKETTGSGSVVQEDVIHPGSISNPGGIHNVMNSSNRCFANSIFQCLVKCRNLMDIVRKNRDYNGDNANIVKSLINLLLAFSGDGIGNYGANIEKFYTQFIRAEERHPLRKAGGIDTGGGMEAPSLLLDWSKTKAQQDANEHSKQIFEILFEIPGIKELINIEIDSSRICRTCKTSRPKKKESTYANTVSLNHSDLANLMRKEMEPALQESDIKRLSERFNNFSNPMQVGETMFSHCFNCVTVGASGNLCQGYKEPNYKGDMKEYLCPEVASEALLDRASDMTNTKENHDRALAELEAYRYKTPDGEEYSPGILKPGKCHNKWNELSSITKAPELLILDESILRRYSWNDLGPTTVHYHIPIEEILDIPIFGGDKVIYQLSSICYHTGGFTQDGRSAGHYMALVRGNDNKYYDVNDLHCEGEPCNEKGRHYFELDGPGSKGRELIGKHSVLYFYEKVN